VSARNTSYVAFANTNFRVLSRDGYKTDCGRVHIIYGQPDDDRHPNETEMFSEVYRTTTFSGVLFVRSPECRGD
jgi:GWxTD domain-containing protein